MRATRHVRLPHAIRKVHAPRRRGKGGMVHTRNSSRPSQGPHESVGTHKKTSSYTSYTRRTILSTRGPTPADFGQRHGTPKHLRLRAWFKRHGMLPCVCHLERNNRHTREVSSVTIVACSIHSYVERCWSKNRRFESCGRVGRDFIPARSCRDVCADIVRGKGSWSEQLFCGTQPVRRRHPG